MLLKRDFTVATAITSLQQGWFRGNTADVLAAAMRVGITMPAFALYKRVLQRGLVTFAGADPDDQLPRWGVFASGALAGATASIAYYPLEVARTRVAIACDVRYGVFGCLVGIFREEGAFAMYNGLTTTLAGVLPFNAIKLAAYDLLRRQATEGANRERDADTVSLPVASVAAMGAVSGVLAATSCFPLEVVRRRQMVGELSGLSPLAALLAIMRTEGPQALMRGAGLNVVKVSLGNSLGFVLYEIAKDALSVDGRTPPWAKDNKAATKRRVDN